MHLISKIKKKINNDGFFLFIIAVFKYLLFNNYLNYLIERRRIKNIILNKTVSERFHQIYTSNFWGSNESKSGKGSELLNTESLRLWIIDKINKLNINVLVDAPCGDFNWMRLVLPDVKVKYIGIDIVEPLIIKNHEKFANNNIEFLVGDICYDILPKCDLLIVRDCLFHFSVSEINKFLNNIYHVDYNYLLTTNNIVDDKFINKDIQTGDYRPIDLFSSPFNFNKNDIIDKFSEQSGRQEMILIKKKDVPKLIEVN